MSTYTQIYYHVIFSTKDRRPVLTKDRREELFRYIWGVIKNCQCHLYRLNGVEDHVHILVGLHPTQALADLVKHVKTGSSKWIKENNIFPGFVGWQDGYGAFTLSSAEKDAVIEYIKGQEEHHKRFSFRDEFRKILEEAGVKFEEKYLP
jgi:REP element-mobilizing transposase RayT